MPKYRWSGTTHGRKTSGEMTAHSEGELRARLGKLVNIQSVEMLSSDIDEQWHGEIAENAAPRTSPSFGARLGVLLAAAVCAGVAAAFVWFAHGDITRLSLPAIIVAVVLALLSLLMLAALVGGFLPGVRKRAATFVASRRP
jgi:hypothetical protein